MKTVLMTGLSGSLGPKVSKQFQSRGWNVLEWNHHQVSPSQENKCKEFWHSHHFDAVCHMAMGSEDWASWLAQQCLRENLPYLFVSTAMVFDAKVNGPYGIFSQRNAVDDYGQYKIRSEDAIWQVNPNAMIARIGWQMHDDSSGNNMLAHLEAQHREKGVLTASTHWYPATSHMDDTALAFLQLIERNEAGLYHLDSNAQERWSFYELVCALKLHYGKDWQVVPCDDYQHDQRLQDERIGLPPLSSRFKRPQLLCSAGILGSKWGRTHVPHYRAAGLDVAAMCAKNLPQLEQVCAAENIVRATTDIHELNDLDVVTVATPADQHSNCIETLSRPNLICEKPLLGLHGDIQVWAKSNQRILVNYAFAQLETAKCIEQWLDTQNTACDVILDCYVNLPGDMSVQQWFVEVASHPLSWLLHYFGEFSQAKVTQSDDVISVQLSCGVHRLSINLMLNGEEGIEYQFNIRSDSTLNCKGYYRVGKKWRFEPVEVDGKAINHGEYTESDCWQDANRRSVALMIAMFNRSVDWEFGLRQGAFDTRKAILIEKVFAQS
ncbi:dTDP-4-dehydrorhamnose reductase [Vibrio galatheae]|uniref:dTDP-4-dehydrorhamnose reductase n=1 Tax=Vibrio galatheae TaxID=579748 RepID=A0A0F4NFF9_9VIBR|nr:sugar nucleotide-binding protein [Vibrio galatheae]KJY81852.1 dTDP-4-dehydrorhamnose reductase [Vibrio galatheae]